jgi:DNA polymerase-3 subunit beta
MKFSIEKRDLQSRIQHLIGITPSKNTMPILTNYLIEASEETNSIRFTATDLEITVIADIAASVTQSGKVVVSAKYFNEMVALLPDDMVFVTAEEEILKVVCAKSKFQFNCADASQFPLVPRVDLTNTIEIDSMMFKKMFASTYFAVGNDMSRPVFTGICWILQPDKQIMVATDGKKIAEFTVFSPLDMTEELRQIVPIKGLMFLDKVITPDVTGIKILMESNRIMLIYGNYTIFSHVIQGRFPEYTKVIPKNNNNVLIIDKERLKHSVKRVALLATEDTSRIKLDITQKVISIFSLRTEEGEATDTIEEFDYQGEPLVTAYNFRYLYSILNVIETEKVKLILGGSADPAIIQNTEKKENYDSLFVLMPLRLA